MEDSVKDPVEKANAEIGYGPNNPEPIQVKESNEKINLEDDALHSASEYINGVIDE